MDPHSCRRIPTSTRMAPVLGSAAADLVRNCYLQGVRLLSCRNGHGPLLLPGGVPGRPHVYGAIRSAVSAGDRGPLTQECSGRENFHRYASATRSSRGNRFGFRDESHTNRRSRCAGTVPGRRLSFISAPLPRALPSAQSCRWFLVPPEATGRRRRFPGVAPGIPGAKRTWGMNNSDSRERRGEGCRPIPAGRLGASAAGQRSLWILTGSPSGAVSVLSSVD